MKVSIVLPVYNGEETLKECMQAILDIDYPKDSYELVIVNDCSKDSSKEIILKMKKSYKEKGLDIKFIDFEKNKGRIEARMAGAKNTKYENLLFIDHRCIVDKQILKEIEIKNYEPIIGNPYQDPNKNIVSRFFYTLRFFLYKPYFGLEYPDVYIDKNNFDSIAKGFSPFLCNKKRFFKSLPKNKGKDVSDDTLILSKIIEEKEILKTSNVKCIYNERSDLKSVIKHMYQRGPKFVDFYMNTKSKYFFIIPLIILFPFLFISLIYLLKIWFVYLFLALTLFVIGVLLILGISLKQILSVFIIGPLILVSFGGGIYKGVLSKLLRIFKLNINKNE